MINKNSIVSNAIQFSYCDCVCELCVDLLLYHRYSISCARIAYALCSLLYVVRVSFTFVLISKLLAVVLVTVNSLCVINCLHHAVTGLASLLWLWVICFLF